MPRLLVARRTGACESEWESEKEQSKFGCRAGGSGKPAKITDCTEKIYTVVSRSLATAGGPSIKKAAPKKKISPVKKVHGSVKPVIPTQVCFWPKRSSV